MNLKIRLSLMCLKYQTNLKTRLYLSYQMSLNYLKYQMNQMNLKCQMNLKTRLYLKCQMNLKIR